MRYDPKNWDSAEDRCLYLTMSRVGRTRRLVNNSNLPVPGSLRARLIANGQLVPRADVSDWGLMLDEAAYDAHMSSTPEGDEQARREGNGIPDMMAALAQLRRPSLFVKGLLRPLVMRDGKDVTNERCER